MVSHYKRLAAKRNPDKSGAVERQLAGIILRLLEIKPVDYDMMIQLTYFAQKAKERGI